MDLPYQLRIYYTQGLFFLGKVIEEHPDHVILENARMVLNMPKGQNHVSTMIIPLPGDFKDNQLRLPLPTPNYEPNDDVKTLWVENVTGLVVGPKKTVELV